MIYRQGHAPRAVNLPFFGMGLGMGQEANVGATSTMFVQTGDATVGNTTVEGTVIGTGVGSLTFLPSFWAAGKMFRFRAWGYYTTAAAGAGNLRVRAYLGSTVILDTTSLGVTPSLGTPQLIGFTGDVVCRSVSATGTVYAQGQGFQATTVAAQSIRQLINTSTSTHDMTGNLAFNLTALWSVQDVVNTMTITNLLLETFSP